MDVRNTCDLLHDMIHMCCKIHIVDEPMTVWEETDKKKEKMLYFYLLFHIYVCVLAFMTWTAALKANAT